VAAAHHVAQHADLRSRRHEHQLCRQPLQRLHSVAPRDALRRRAVQLGLHLGTSVNIRLSARWGPWVTRSVKPLAAALSSSSRIWAQT